MRFYIITILFNLFLAVTPVLSFAQIEYSFIISSDSISIGDDLDVEIKLLHAENVDVKSLRINILDSLGLMKYLFPEDSNLVNEKNIPVDFEISDSGDWEIDASMVLSLNAAKSKLSNHLKIKVWDAGTFALLVDEIIVYEDAATENVIYPDIRGSQLVYIQVPESKTMDEIELRPIKDILGESWHWLDFKWLYIVLLVLGLFVFLITRPKRKKRKQSRKEKLIPPRPAHEIAKEKLEKLKVQGLLEREEYKVFQTSLSFIIREYLENRYQIKALESTTPDIVMAIQNEKLKTGDLNMLRDLLQIADLVKFAKAKPEEKIHMDFLQRAFDFVDKTKLIIEKTSDNI